MSSRRKKAWTALAVVLAAVASVAFSLKASGPEVQLETCSYNLYTLGGLCDLHVAKEGRAPETLEALVPEYTDTLPVCPAADRTTYQLSETRGPTADATWYVYCAGDHHAESGVPPDYPGHSEMYRGFAGREEIRPGVYTSTVWLVDVSPSERRKFLRE